MGESVLLGHFSSEWDKQIDALSRTRKTVLLGQFLVAGRFAIELVAVLRQKSVL